MHYEYVSVKLKYFRRTYPLNSKFKKTKETGMIKEFRNKEAIYT